MLDHVSIGVSDIARSRHFYDAALSALGYRCLMRHRRPALATAAKRNGLVGQRERQSSADPESGLHFCFAPTRKSVQAFHQAALAAGGRDNGAPGLRADYGANYFAAFVVDPEGYRLEAYCSKEG